jgi:hypothetical protein
MQGSKIRIAEQVVVDGNLREARKICRFRLWSPSWIMAGREQFYR